MIIADEKTELKLIANSKDQSFKEIKERVCMYVCEPAKLEKKKKKKILPPLLSRVLPRRAAAAAAALTLQSHPAAEPDADEQAEHIRYTPSTNNETAPQHFTRRFFFSFLSFSPPLRVYFAPAWLRWRDWKCGGAERRGRAPPVASTAPAEGAWSKQPFGRREFWTFMRDDCQHFEETNLTVSMRGAARLEEWRDARSIMDIREGINIIKELKGSTQVNRKELLLIFSTPIFAIVHTVYVLTSIFKMEHKFLPLCELLDLQVVSTVLYSHFLHTVSIPSQQCRNPEQFISLQVHQ